MEGLAVVRRGLFLVSAPLFFINFALPVQSKAIGASALEIGGLFSLFSLSLLLMRPVIGFGIDRFGRRVFFLSALLLYVGAYTGYSFALDIETMYVARFFQGLGASLLLVSVDVMTADLTDATDRGQAMGQNVEVQTRATFLGAFIGFGLIGAVPALAWKFSFALFAGIACFGFIFALIELPETKTEQMAESGTDFEISESLKRLMGVLFLMGVASALIQPIYLIYLQDGFTTDSRILSWAFLPAGIIYALLPSKMGALADNRGPLGFMLIGMITAGILYFAMSYAPGFWSLVVIYSTSVVGWTMIEPSRKTLIARCASSSTVARTFGTAEMAAGLGATLGPLIGGYLYDHVSHQSPFIFNGVLMLFAAGVASVILQNSSDAKTGQTADLD